MANCPKCGHHLRMIDWKQKCPYCGTNIVIYNQQERLMAEADIAEVQYYHFQKKIDRLKASFAGSKLAIARVVTSLLPIAPLFLPIVKGTASSPLEAFDGSLDVIKFYETVSKMDFGALFGLVSQPDNKTAGICLIAALVCFVLSVVLWLLHFIFLMLACSPKGKQRNYTVNSLMLIFAIAAGAAVLAAPQNAVYSLRLGVGAYLYVALIVVNFAVDIATFVKGIEVKHKQCYVGGIPIEEYFRMVDEGIPQDEIRQEMYKRLNAIHAEKLAKLAAEEAKAESKEAKTQ